jgi:hypothetical protein
VQSSQNFHRRSSTCSIMNACMTAMKTLTSVIQFTYFALYHPNLNARLKLNFDLSAVLFLDLSETDDPDLT